MKVWNIGPLKKKLAAKARRAYRYSELKKCRDWLKGKTLHWAVYLTVASLLVVGALTLHNYLRSFLFMVSIDGQAVGFVRETEDIEQFISSLLDTNSAIYGMSVVPGEEIAFSWGYHPRKEADADAVREALKQRVSFVAPALMVTVDDRQILPVRDAAAVDQVVQMLCQAFISQQDNVRLLDVSLAEDVAGKPVALHPEEIRTAEEVASLLLAGGRQREVHRVSRGDTLIAIASRHGMRLEELREANPGVQDILQIGQDLELTTPQHMINVTTVEELQAVESIPFPTSYTYNSSMWSVQRRVSVPGVPGKKQVVYHVTRENGVEIAREKVAETVVEEPVTQVIERGTARVPSYGTGRFLWPIPVNVDRGGRITQGFRGFAHRGLDITAAAGSNTPIIASDGGVVVVSEFRWPMGHYIIIYHGAFYTLYLHNRVNLVSAGDVVGKGQTIAYMGNTGRSTGVHLHFEIRRSDGSGVWRFWDQHTPLNPLDFFRP